MYRLSCDNVEKIASCFSVISLRQKKLCIAVWSSKYFNCSLFKTFKTTVSCLLLIKSGPGDVGKDGLVSTCSHLIICKGKFLKCLLAFVN